MKQFFLNSHHALPARSQREASFARPLSSCVDRSSEAHTAGSRMKYDGSLSLTGSMPCVCVCFWNAKCFDDELPNYADAEVYSAASQV